jgi:hypothetical protein
MAQLKHAVSGDVIVVEDALADYFKTQGPWQDVVTEEDVAAEVAVAGELKGAELDAALEESGLSKSGSADEKRQRLADHIASIAFGGQFGDTIKEQ